MKNKLLLLLGLIGFLASAKAQSYDFSAVSSNGDTLYYSVSGTNATVTYPGAASTSAWVGHTEPSGALVIPSSVNHNGTDYTVVAIGSYAFYTCIDITSVVLPATITSIGQDAFYLCGSMTSITLPASITSIGVEAFRSCVSLTSITLPNQVTEIANNCFKECYGLTSVNLPSSLVRIGQEAFSNCSALASVTIPTRVFTIGNSAFASCSSLASVTFNATVCNMMGSASALVFANCSHLSQVTVGDSVSRIPANAFKNCTHLATVNFPASVKSIGIDAFDNTALVNNESNYSNNLLVVDSCLLASQPALAGSFASDGIRIMAPRALASTQITSATLLPPLVEVPAYAFENCSLLSHLDMPITVTTVGNAFSGCEQLTRIVFPDSVKKISSSVIHSPMKSITFGERFSGFNEYNFNTDENIVLDTLRFRGSLCSEQTLWWKNFNYNRQYNFRTPFKALFVPCGAINEFYRNGWQQYGPVQSDCSSITIQVVSSDPWMQVFPTRYYSSNGDSTYSFNGTIRCEPGQQMVFYAGLTKVTESDNSITSYDLVADHWSTGETSDTIVYTALHDDTVTLYSVTKPFATLDINNINTTLDIYGSLGYNNRDAAYFFLSDSTPTITSTGLWLDGMDGDSLHLAAHRYGKSGCDYQPGHRNDPLLDADATANPWNRVWKMSRRVIDYHLAHVHDNGYLMGVEMATWPGPYIDIDSNGFYSPMGGDYPLIRGDQALYTIFNDNRSHLESRGAPMDIEVHMMAYAFKESDNDGSVNPLNNTVFVNYKVYNRSDRTYSNCHMGSFADIDLGYAFDDFIGCDVSRQLFYCYNGNETDGPGVGAFQGVPPAQACLFLGGAQDGQGGRQGMSQFICFYNNYSDQNGDPYVAADYANYLRGQWLNGRKMIYGGNGFGFQNTDTLTCEYMYPGNSDPQHLGTHGIVPAEHADDWTEPTAGISPGDRRGLATSGPFDFAPGESHEFDLAYVAAKAEEGSAWSSVELMLEGADAVRRQYERDTTDSGRSFFYIPLSGETMGIARTLQSQGLQLYPNPTQGMLHISLPVGGNCAAELYDIMGHRVASCTIADGQADIDLSALPCGIYMLKCNGEVRRIVKR